jgi:hypothetical protein
MLPLLQVFLVCLIAGCSICWFNTVCFVLCIRSFSASNRSLALSLSISFNGLSAAFYTLFANALSPFSPAVYLLLNAILPLGVSVLALPAILLCHQNDGHVQSAPRHDGRVFLGLYILAFITGIYLVVFGSFTATSSTAWVILTGAMVLLALPFIIPACSSCSYVDTDGPDPASPLNHDDPHKPLLISNNHQMESNAMMQNPKENQMQGNCCGTVMGKGRLATLGEEHSAKKLIRCVDFWLYYTAYFCGATVGLVYSNNLGQIAQSLNQQSQLTMLLAVYSSCSFFGRLLSALPDLHRYLFCFIYMHISDHITCFLTKICIQEDVTCSHRVACCCIGPHANGLFPYVEATRWKHPGSRNSTNWSKLRVHLCCSSVSDLRALWTQ